MSVDNVVFFLGNESCATKSHPTKRAADWWDSSRLTGIFLASGFFLLPSQIHARPPAANANR